MLILTRKIGESIRIGDDIVVTVEERRGNHIRLSIKADRDIPVHREEIYHRILALKQAKTVEDKRAIAA